MKKLWFHNKKYGWGWTPVTWQGWFVILVGVGTIILIAATTDFARFDALAWYLVKLLSVVSLMLTIVYYKGELPRWQWGDQPERDRDDQSS